MSINNTSSYSPFYMPPPPTLYPAPVSYYAPPPIPPNMNPLPPMCMPPPPIFYGNKDALQQDTYKSQDRFSLVSSIKKEKEKYSNLVKTLLIFAALGGVKGALSTLGINFLAKKFPKPMKKLENKILNYQKKKDNKIIKRVTELMLKEIKPKSGSKIPVGHIFKNGVFFAGFAGVTYLSYLGLKHLYDKFRNN